MKEKIESRCWDCPSRTGISRVCGNLAIKFWKRGDLSGQRIKEQRRDCSGAVPARFSQNGTGYTIPEGETAIHRTVWHDLYFAVCPKDCETPPESPDEVKVAMRNNNLDAYVHERIEEYTEPLADYEQRIAKFNEQWKSIGTQAPSIS